MENIDIGFWQKRGRQRKEKYTLRKSRGESEYLFIYYLNRLCSILNGFGTLIQVSLIIGFLDIDRFRPFASYRIKAGIAMLWYTKMSQLLLRGAPKRQTYVQKSSTLRIIASCYKLRYFYSIIDINPLQNELTKNEMVFFFS